MTFPFPTICPLSAVRVEYIDETNDTADATTYTFSGHAIGTAAADRIVHVGICGANNAGATQSVTSVTIGGVEAEINCAANTGGTNGFSAAIASLAVPTGTTADIVVTFGGGQFRCRIAVWASYGGYSHVAYSAGTDTTGDPLAVSLNIPSGGIAIAIAKLYRATAYVGGTWANITEDFDSGSDAATQGETGASGEYSSTQTGLSIEVDNDSAANVLQIMAAASFGPSRYQAWSSGGALATARHSLAGCGTQTAGLSFGGTLISNSPTDATEEYNGSTWSGGGALATARAILAGCGTQTAGLAFGGDTTDGETGGVSAVTEEYNGTAWSGGGALATARSGLAGCGTQTAGLSFGGNTGSVRYVTEEYDGSTWSSGGALATARWLLAGAGTQTAGLSFGGNAGSASAVTEEYDGSTWSSGGALATARERLAGCGTQSAGLSFGGYTGSASAVTEEYSGVAWSSGGALGTATYYLAGCGTQSAGLSFGGIGPTAVTEEYI